MEVHLQNKQVTFLYHDLMTFMYDHEIDILNMYLRTKDKVSQAKGFKS